MATKRSPSRSLTSADGLHRFIEFGDPEWKPDEEGQSCNICAVRIEAWASERERRARICETNYCKFITPFVPLVISEALGCSPGGITAGFVAQ